jgi:formate dehydrogenase subunit gamma
MSMETPSKALPAEPSCSAEPARASAAVVPDNSKILRFARSERLLHWCIAGPFLISFTTAVVLVFVYNPDRSRPFRYVFATLHRVSGVALIVLPILATLKLRGDARVHFYNIRQAWTWVFDDIKWLSLMFAASFSSRVRLPEQGKFNAAEKLNFMVLMVTYPLYVATGVLIWATHVAVLSWLLHFAMALLSAPLILGHMYMALLSRSGRPGLQGMISGYVDRHWAKHHYRRWYREHHEHTETAEE